MSGFAGRARGRSVFALRTFVGAASLVVVVLVVACSDPLDVERDAFRVARNRWERAAVEDYAFDYQHFCFCGPDELRQVRIAVYGGEVSSATYVDTGEPTQRPPGDFPTLDDLFDVIGDAIRRDAFSLTVTYDEEMGYPTGASIDYRENVADEEMGFVVSGFEPVTVVN
jgi:Family of unknown function (DUF6174)